MDPTDTTRSGTSKSLSESEKPKEKKEQRRKKAASESYQQETQEKTDSSETSHHDEILGIISGKKWTVGDVVQLVKKMTDPVSGVPCKDRKWLLRTYKNCFVGREAVDWFIEHNYAANRADAVSLGNLLLNNLIFRHVTKDHIFKDEYKFYRFEKGIESFGSEKPEGWSQFLQAATAEELSEESSEAKEESDEDQKLLLPQRRSNTNINPILTELEMLEIKPLDKWNLKLLDQVHPKNWQNPTPKHRYHMIVIGAGAAGLVTAAACAGLGANVAIIEKHLMGGDCLNYGCVPSKALIRVANQIYSMKNCEEFGLKIEGNLKIDFGAIMERMRRLRAEIARNDSVERYSKVLGVDVYIGEASFVNKSKILVNGKTLKFHKACIATGSRPGIPSIPGIDSVKYLTNETVFNLTELPKKFGVIGAGFVGCELAQAFARFGSKVTIFARSGILPREDQDAVTLLVQQFTKEGIEILNEVNITSISQKESEITVVAVDKEGKIHERVFNEVLVAVGRVPNVAGLNLEAAGIKYDREGIKVNATLQTSNHNVYACGDCCSEYKFTHMADAMARIVVRNSLFMGRAKVSQLIIPWCTYTQPEIAHVGSYENDLIKAGLKIQTFRVDFKDIDRSILDGDDLGFVKVVVKEGTDKVMGATIVHRNAGDLISELTVLMHSKLGLTGLANIIHPYPTQAEAIRKVGDLYNRSRLTPLVRVILRKIIDSQK